MSMACAIPSCESNFRYSHGSADILVADLSDVAASQKALEPGEPWNILVNNAGTNKPQAFVDVDKPMIGADGRPELQVYRRTLTGGFMKLEFTRIVDGTTVRNARGRLIKVAG